jgi:hypothetical protein
MSTVFGLKQNIPHIIIINPELLSCPNLILPSLISLLMESGGKSNGKSDNYLFYGLNYLVSAPTIRQLLYALTLICAAI